MNNTYLKDLWPGDYFYFPFRLTLYKVIGMECCYEPPYDIMSTVQSEHGEATYNSTNVCVKQVNSITELTYRNIVWMEQKSWVDMLN